MSDYSVYVLFDEERCFQTAAIIDCSDDGEAIRMAEQWVDLHDVELWQSNRFITRFTPLLSILTRAVFGKWVYGPH